MRSAHLSLGSSSRPAGDRHFYMNGIREISDSIMIFRKEPRGVGVVMLFGRCEISMWAGVSQYICPSGLWTESKSKQYWQASRQIGPRR